MNSPSKPSQLKSRLILLLIALMFFGSFFVAFGLRMSGWTPAQSKNFGELLNPPVDLTQVKLQSVDGKSYAWAPLEDRFRVVVRAPDNCGDVCVQLHDTLYRVWYSRGRHAARIDVLWFGPKPDMKQTVDWSGFKSMQDSAELFAAMKLPTNERGVPVYLIDSKGFLIMQYEAGFDPSGLRKDLSKLVK